MTDIDADWNPEECSLDAHRMKKLETLEQPGFGIHAKPVTTEPVPQAEPVVDDAQTEEQ